MASNGHSTGGHAIPNGTSPHLSHRPQTPAYTVGNQFVGQFYMVLHQNPEYLFRFYTDDSTVTHSDCGSDTEAPSCVTVSTQKEIRQRVQTMWSDNAETEVWSVDSQYSSMNGVMVQVTGAMTITGKKKRNFVQSFFLATQEKGYFVLNDQFRLLSDFSSLPPSNLPKEPYSNQHNPALQAGLYHQPQQAQQAQVPPYYQQSQQPPQPAHATYTTPYQNSQPNQAHHQPIRHSAVTPPASQYTQKPQPASRPVTQQAGPVTDSPTSEPQPAEAAALKPAPAAVEAPKPAPAAPAPAPPAKEESPKPVAEAESKLEPAAQAVATKATQTAAAEPAKAPAPEKQKPAAPSAPLTYAERVRLSANAAAAQKPAPASRVAPPAQQSRPAPAPQQRPMTSPPTPAVQPPETAAAAPPAGQESANESNSGKEEDVVTTSIFVRNLPEDITAEKLQEVFSEYGTIKNGVQGVSLKHKPGGDFAFVDFEDAAAMQAAIAAKVVIDEKVVSVVERRPLVGRAANRSGRGDGRGFRGRGEGRGRGGRDARPHTTGGRSEAREPRPEGGRGGRSYENRGTEGGRGRGERGRARFAGRNGPPQNAPQPQPTAA